MERQKRVALINDVTGFGRCSIASMLPIISAMKIQGVLVPTAILSADTYIPNYYFDDYTKRMPDYIKTYKGLGLSFDGICTGFLGSPEQVEIVKDFLQFFGTKDTFIIVDPVMGDHGKLYPVYSEEMKTKMKELVNFATIVTPNLTELCALLDVVYPAKIPLEEQLEKMCEKLSKRGPKKIVITGLPRGRYIENFIYQKGKPSQKIIVRKIGGDRSGTGDVFTAVLAGSYTKGYSFYDSVKKAVLFTDKCIRYSEKLQTPFNYGLCFEEFLTDL